MRHHIALALILCFLAEDASAKTKLCFTKAEESAEQIIRSGLRMREGANACDGLPYRAGTKPLWERIDQQFGARFKQQTDIRRAAFIREFGNDAENRVQMWDGRIVFHFRYYPLSAVYCAGVKDELTDVLKKGWPVLVKRAKLRKDEVEEDYETCP